MKLFIFDIPSLCQDTFGFCFGVPVSLSVPGTHNVAGCTIDEEEGVRTAYAILDFLV